MYARFGLAVYHSQVLEHGIVNALVFVDLIPNKMRKVSTQAAWESNVDMFMDSHFESTMGRLMKSLRDIAVVPTELDDMLRLALKRRNWLAHGFFRANAENFMTTEGRLEMLAELDYCRTCFRGADSRLEETVRPLRENAGVTEEMIEQEYQRMVSALPGRRVP